MLRDAHFPQHILTVMLQPMKDEPPLNFKCKDKFLIQSIAITPEKEQLPLADLVCCGFLGFHPVTDGFPSGPFLMVEVRMLECTSRSCG